MDGDRELARALLQSGLLEQALADREAPRVPPRYAVVRRLGEGGAGVVYLAEDRTLDRRVALKVLKDAGPADLARFRREARFTARLADPAIVQVYDQGEHEGQPYIAMQYVDGGNLATVRPPRRELVRIVRDVALALHHAHAIGIVHRDVKPENVLLDGALRVFVTDFGIARDVAAAPGETLSRHGQIMGTPALMPPEQARGDPQAVDARSDVYALGATLFHALTRRYPFEAATVVDVLHAVLHDEAPLVRAFDASIPRELEAVVARCLAKPREARYPSMRALADDLERCLAESSAPQASGAWLRRLVTNRVGAPPGASDAAAPDHDSDPDWTEGLTAVRELASWDADLYRVSGSLEASFERLDAIRARLEAILARRPDAAWARFHRGVALFRRGELREALEEMERSIGRVRDPAGAHFELGRLYLALYLRSQDQARRHISARGVTEDLGSARTLLEQAVVMFAEARRLPGALAPWHLDYARAVALLGESDFQGCVAACDAILEREPDREEVWKLRGDALAFLGQDPVESYERALAVRRSDFETLAALARCHLARGDRSRALEALERARAIHPGYVEAHVLAARVLLEQARAEPTEDALEAALEAAVAARRRDPRDYEAAVTLAEVLWERARRGADTTAFERALATLGEAGGLAGCQNRVNLLESRVRLERALFEAAAGRDPRPELERVRASCERALPYHEPGETVWHEVHARVLGELARLDAR